MEFSFRDVEFADFVHVFPAGNFISKIFNAIQQQKVARKTYVLKSYRQLNISLGAILGSLKSYGRREHETTLQKIWNYLLQKQVAGNIQNFHKRLQACVDKAGGHLEYFI